MSLNNLITLEHAKEIKAKNLHLNKTKKKLKSYLKENGFAPLSQNIKGKHKRKSFRTYCLAYSNNRISAIAKEILLTELTNTIIDNELEYLL